MNKAHNEYNVSELCCVLEVAPSTYYYKSSSTESPKEIQMENDLLKAFEDSNETYGKRRLLIEMLNKGHFVGIAKIRSLMKKHNLIAINPQKKHYYPDSGEECIYASNVLNRQFKPNTIGTHWVADITFVKTKEGWCYLACVLDLGSREIVGYATSKSPDTQLVIQALFNAIHNTQVDTTKLMFHSDQGCQYSSKIFRSILKAFGIKQSMSRRGNCWDNAVMERFFRNLKTEHLKRVVILNFNIANKIIDEYIRFYNFRRINSAIEYLTPYQKRQQIQKAA